MKVTFGRKVLNAMPVTARQTLLCDNLTIAIPMESAHGPCDGGNFNNTELLVVPTAPICYPIKTKEPRTDIVPCDQMYKCCVTTEAKKEDDVFNPYGNITNVKVDATLIAGDTLSASELMSTHTFNVYLPNEVRQAVRKAIYEVAIDQMKDPNA